MNVRIVSCLILLMGAASGQAQSPLRPDALILVQPMGNRAELAVVFPRPVSHKEAAARIARIGTITGWTVGAVRTADRTITSGGKAGKPIGKQTEVTAKLTNAPQIASNAFVLQPYLQAFSDLSRIELLYVFPRDSRFSGIREFDSPGLSVRLINPGGPYRYVVDFKAHRGQIAQVPLNQPVAATSTVAASTNAAAPSTAPTRSGDPTRTLFLILGIAAGSGVLAYAALRFWGRHHASVHLRGSAGRLSRL